MLGYVKLSYVSFEVLVVLNTAESVHITSCTLVSWDPYCTYGSINITPSYTIDN